MGLRCCEGPSAARPGAHKPCARKDRVASVGMTAKKVGGALLHGARMRVARAPIFFGSVDTHYYCIGASRIGILGGPMRILIADDHEVIRSSVIRVLQSRGDVEECAEATNGKEAVEKAVEWKPDLILLDVRLPVLCGFDAAKEIKQQAPDILILLFSIHNTQEILDQARAVGDGFLLKDRIVEMLPNAIDALRRKEKFFPSDQQTEPES